MHTGLHDRLRGTTVPYMQHSVPVKRPSAASAPLSPTFATDTWVIQHMPNSLVPRNGESSRIRSSSKLHVQRNSSSDCCCCAGTPPACVYMQLIKHVKIVPAFTREQGVEEHPIPAVQSFA